MGEAPILKETRIAASPETVFRFLVDPLRMTRWLGVAAEIDPRPGGSIRIDVNGRDVVVGEIVAIDPPRRIVFTWGWEREDSATPPGSTTVEIRLEPDGDGTRLRLEHRGLPPDVREPHAAGWEHYLARLSVCAAGGDPGPDPLATPEIVHGAPGTSPSGPLDDASVSDREGRNT